MYTVFNYCIINHYLIIEEYLSDKSKAKTEAKAEAETQINSCVKDFKKNETIRVRSVGLLCYLF